MKRILTITFVLSIAGSFCAVAGFFSYYYYTLYQNSVNGLEARIESRVSTVETELKWVKEHRPHVRSIRLTGFVSTTDHEPKGFLTAVPTNEPVQYHVSNSKFGWLIEPEIRLPKDSDICQHEFIVNVEPHAGWVLDAWVSPSQTTDPHPGIDEIYVPSFEATNSFTLIIRPKPKTSIHHEFTVVVLVESRYER